MTVRVLLLSRAALVASYRPKLAAIARHPDVELTVVVPPRWREPGRVQELEPGPTPGYELVTEPIVMNGSFHTHWYPGLARRVRALQPDIVHIEEEPYNLATLQAARLAARCGARVVCFTWQNIERRYPPPFSFVERSTLARVDHLVCGSRAALDVWRAKGYDGDASVIPQVGVDPDTWTPRGADSPPHPFRVGYVGRLVPEKGVDILLRAFAEARANLPAGAHLVVAGEGPARLELVAQAKRLGLGDECEFRGWAPSDELPTLVRDLDVLVLPSRTSAHWKEQFGRVLVEAMASGVAVIGTDSGEIPHVIGHDGVVVPEDDVDALRAAIERLGNDPALVAALGTRGRGRVIDEFTQARVADRTVDIYRAATARRPRVTIVAHEIHDDGGMEAAMAHLVRRAHQDWEITVVAAHVDPALRPLVHWRRVPTPAAPFALRLLTFATLAAPRVRSSNAALVHTLGAIVPNRADLATVQYCHAGAPADARTAGEPMSPARAANARLAQWASVAVERWCYRPARLRRCGAVSPGVADEFRDAYPGIPVTVTPNGVDLDRFAPDPAVRTTVRAEAGVDRDDVVVLFVGGDWPRKGLALAIAAVGRLAKEGASLRLWVVGRGDVERYTALAVAAGIGDRVTFFGFRTDRERFFRGADVFTLPTRYETFCIAAFEAAAAELPIVMTRVNDVGALVRDGSGGALVDVDADADAIADALAPFVADPARRAADGRAARARAEHYTWNASAASVLTLYRELVGVVG